MMATKTWWESIKVEGGQLLDKVKQIVHEGNVRRVVIKQGDRTIAEFPLTAEKMLRTRVMNAPLLMSLDASDFGLAPTWWQHRQFPVAYKPRIATVHDGIDTDLVCPQGEPEEELITYVSRNLEPYRGFHTFMRAIPEIQRRRPKARIVIVGGDDVSYSPRLAEGETYRQRLLKELDVDPQARAEQMGHTVDVNENVYTRTSLERRREAVNKLEKALRVN
jgi:glycosyltransferase involved in cell wall biosynthesis